MSSSRLLPAFAALAFVAALPLLTVDASARTSAALKECNARWKTAQANETVPAGMQWPDYAKTMCGLDVSAGAATAAPAPAPAPATTTSSGGSFMEQCSAAWKQLKASNAVPAGLTWREFVKAKCVVAGAAAPAPTPPATTPPTETNYNQQPVQNWRTIPVAQTDKNGKPFSKGQIEAHQRIKECAAEWHKAKADNTLPAGAKWPQFWSQCNTRLKTQN